MRSQRNLKFSNLTRLDDRVVSAFIFQKWNSTLVYSLQMFLRFNTFRTILIVQLTFLNFNYWKNNLKFLSVPPFAYHQWYAYLLLLLLQLYNSLWVLVCSIISFHFFLSCFVCFQLFTPIFLKYSSHRLPILLLAFPSVLLLTVSICIWSWPLFRWSFFLHAPTSSIVCILYRHFLLTYPIYFHYAM